MRGEWLTYGTIAGYEALLVSILSRTLCTCSVSKAGVLPSLRENFSVFDLPSRIHGQNAFLDQPGKEHPDRGHMLLNSCWRARVLFDVCRHRDRLISSVTRSPTMWLTHAQYGPARHFRMEALGYHTQIPRPWLKLYPTYVGLRIWRISCRLSAAR